MSTAISKFLSTWSTHPRRHCASIFKSRFAAARVQPTALLSWIKSACLIPSSVHFTYSTLIWYNSILHWFRWSSCRNISSLSATIKTFHQVSALNVFVICTSFCLPKMNFRIHFIEHCIAFLIRWLQAFFLHLCIRHKVHDLKLIF